MKINPKPFHFTENSIHHCTFNYKNAKSTMMKSYIPYQDHYFYTLTLFLSSKHFLYSFSTFFIHSLLKRVSVKRGPDTCGWRMRTGKCGWKNADGKKCGQQKKYEGKNEKCGWQKKKINKQTNKGKKSFFQVAVTWLDPSPTYIHSVPPP